MLFGTSYFCGLTSFGPRKKSADVFLTGLPKLCEDIGDVFLGIDLVQPRHPYDRHEDSGGPGSLLWIAEKEELALHQHKEGRICDLCDVSACEDCHPQRIRRPGL